MLDEYRKLRLGARRKIHFLDVLGYGVYRRADVVSSVFVCSRNYEETLYLLNHRVLEVPDCDSGEDSYQSR